MEKIIKPLIIAGNRKKKLKLLEVLLKNLTIIKLSWVKS